MQQNDDDKNEYNYDARKAEMKINSTHSQGERIVP